MSTRPFMNLTLRAARWSAAHRWRAVLGWLGFVLVAFARGSSYAAAAMTLLGDWNWYLPGWLEWLPRITPGETPRPPAVAVAPATQGSTAAAERRTQVGV